MKAPNVIYVASYNGEAFSHSWTMEPLGDTTATKYIRKDALLEWLDGKLTIEGATEGYVGGYDSALKDVIDKLNSM